MVPSSIHEMPMMAKNTAPTIHAMIAAGPDRATADKVASSQPDPI